MNNIHLRRTPWLLVAAFFLVIPAAAQKAKPKPKPTPVAAPVIFAVLQGGKFIEPIATIDGGKLAEGEDGAMSKTFADKYYKPKTSYPIIFGGASDGKLTIVKSNIGTECGGGSADTLARPVKARLAGLVMALATNRAPAADAPAYRRKPTPAERGDIEKLVRAEFTKQGVSAAAQKNLRYHNLTALDVDGDDIPEFVGSYWLAPTATDRRLLFFIAELDANGATEFEFSDYSAVEPDDVMSGDVKDLDGGIYHELLLDVLDVDGDGVKEIFTIRQAFEGNNYYAYKRSDGKWTRIHESYNYRCAY